MVSVELIGGLGNQMFQIAAAMSCAGKYNLPYHIPTQTKNVHSRHPYFTNLTNPAWDASLSPVYFAEQQFHYSPINITDFIVSDKTKNIILSGYFQSWKYWCGVSEKELLKAFDFITGPFQGEPTRFDRVAVHIRRGDYLNYPDKHPFVGEDYIIRAMNHFIKQGYRNFTVFSDDIAWCYDFLNNSARALDFQKPHSYQLQFSEQQDPVKDMGHMSAHSHFILSNSTFGYWAAALSQSAGKQVLYPAAWFGPGYADKDTKDLCPPEWKKV